MEKIDYACGIDCPDNADDEQMLMDYVINRDSELYYLDAYMKETFSRNNVESDS